MPLPSSLKQTLDSFILRMRDKTETYMGYPVSKDFDYQELAELLNYPLNNLGDPFVDSTWKVDSREFERQVIKFFANLLRAPENNWWGYVTNGGTEGNLYGLYLAREIYPKGICYFSQDTHYSVAKNLHLLNMRHIMIRSSENGEIDYEDLKETIKLHRDLPAIIFANSGTTMTEAKDDIKKIQTILDEFSIANRYIHSDSALCGAINPFLSPRPAFDFADGADSISISGHKFIGSPIPCGIVLARKDKVDRIARSIAYIGCLDTTITGSRNGFTPMVLWYAISKWGKEGLAKRAMHSVATAEYAVAELQAIGINAWRNPNAITAVFPEISEQLKEKYQLATANGITHLICMPNIQKHHIDAFVKDLKRELEQGLRGQEQ